MHLLVELQMTEMHGTGYQNYLMCFTAKSWKKNRACLFVFYVCVCVCVCVHFHVHQSVTIYQS